ncbi:hypothetical protein Ga0466249_001529 [Sporomusaceae bacterium BoRhaA]|nr:hypothetical protein [Pelorhabdus rhamnosifermentans]
MVYWDAKKPPSCRPTIRDEGIVIRLNQITTCAGLTNIIVAAIINQTSIQGEILMNLTSSIRFWDGGLRPFNIIAKEKK